ncbi:MAG: hypothetical protein AB7M05_03110 [Alphaproteobacteria bacterium]
MQEKKNIEPELLVTLVLSSKKRHQLEELFENIENTVEFPSQIEVLVKVDEEDPELISYLEEESRHRAYSLRFAVGPRLEGYFSLHHGYSLLHKITRRESYFCHLINDECRYRTKGWDTVLRRYVGFFSDHIFQLRLTRHRLRTYSDVFSAINQPENYPILTKRWLDLAEGWGEFRGPDTWHGGINFMLSNRCEQFRSIPIFDIELGWAEEVAELAPKAVLDLTERNFREFEGMVSRRGQENFLRLAQQLNLGIYAAQHGIIYYHFEYFKRKRWVRLVDDNGCFHQKASYRVSLLNYWLDKVVVRTIQPLLVRRDMRLRQYHFLMPCWWWPNRIIRFQYNLINKCFHLGARMKQEWYRITDIGRARLKLPPRERISNSNG